ncbi:MAG TPA: POTRA domain-containing protein [Bacteroidales bacterium]|nr:POTRA domain-containing protein [Bacteroidales bacterium]HPT51792.1 POTRA domain-containing protein [Bacteroidales bacterium]
MLIKSLHYFGVLFVLLFCQLASYAQVVVTSQDTTPSVSFDYSAPKPYEIGGITISGSGALDQRFLLFHVGETIDIPGDKISKTIKKLWSTGLYEDIKISVTKTMGKTAFLDIYLEDRSRLAAFAFNGAKKSEETEIREKIKISQGNIVNDNLKKTCINIIKDYYIEKGFYNCEISVEEKQDEKISKAVNLFFNIKKGKKVKIDRITFIGNNQVSAAKLLKSMKETKERFHFAPFYKADTVIAYMFKHPDYYKSKDILEHLGDYFAGRVSLRFKGSKFIKTQFEDDKIKLVEKYNELGFRDAYIVKDSFYIKNNLAYVDISVNEGNKYYFRNINFVGNTKFSTELLHQLLNIEKGDVYNQKRLTENISMNPDGNDISSLYMNDGYLFFYANPTEVLIENDSIDIEIRIREGQQATYNNITVSGNTKTNDNVILREVTTLPGQLFNRADIIRSQQVLLSLGYFNQEKMDVIPTPNEADGTVDIEYVVEETSSDQLELSAGYGATGLVLSAGISFNNFSFRKLFDKKAWTPVPSGDGQKISLKISTNAIWYQSYSFSFVEPWLGGKKPNTLSASVYYQVQTNGYSRKDASFASINIVGANVTFAKKLKWPDDYFQLSHGIIYQYYKVNNYGSVFIFSNGYANNISYKFTLMRNSVSAPIYPREGSEIMFSVQATPPYSLFTNKDYATATDQEKYKFLEFHKWKFNLSWFTKLVDNLVLNVRIKTGFIGWYNKNVGAPPFERFYLGGDGLSSWALDGREIIGMRGYDDSALTPLENGDEVGGTIFNKFTAELRYPITLNPSATIYVLGFVEAGKAWNNKRDYSPFNLYKSAGLGVRIYLPMFGLLGFDWGYGFDNVPGRSDAAGSRFHISINQSID